MKKFKIALIAVILILVIGCALLFGLIIYGTFFVTAMKETDDISYYRALSGEIEGECALEVLGGGYVYCPYDLPTLSEMGGYQDYRFQYTAKQEGVFRGDAYTLIFRYGEMEYLSVKEQLQLRYIVKTDGIEGEDETTVPPRFQMNGLSFQAIDGGDYPKEMFFIGTSDKRKEISIVYYYNQDLDSVPQSLAEFLQEESGWNSMMEQWSGSSSSAAAAAENPRLP